MASQPPSGNTRPTTIAEVIARMQAIGTDLEPTDGVACFNRMYLEVTQQVDAQVGQHAFADPAFMSRLDVVFANLYFDAVDAMTASPDQVPTAWAPLMESRANPAIEPIQFALAGMNSHINHDLPLAVVTTCEQLASAPDAGSHHADYQLVDRLLDGAEGAIRQSLEDQLERDVDQHLQRVSDLVANWSINTARDVAWTMSLALWAVRDVALARDMLLDGLAHTVGMASRVLLVAL